MLNLRKIKVIGRTYRNISRYKQILGVLFKYGFGEFVDRLNLDTYFKNSIQLIFRRDDSVVRMSSAQRVRRVLEELGPTFIKFGQIISTRSDLIPLEYARELQKLQDAVPAFDYAAVEEIVIRELGAAPEEIFERFDPEPLAAASIGQVHRAVLKGGDEVVVKMQRPGIEKVLETDLEIMLHLATLIETHIQEAEIAKPTTLVDVFAANLEKEIDYLLEIGNIERFARNFAGESSLYIPAVYRDFSTRRIMTMEFVDGVKASDLAAIEEQGSDPCVIASRGMDLILKQIFEHGFFHADPHPGNILVLPGSRIAFLDFGMMGKISLRDRRYFSDFVMRVARRDERRAARAMLKIICHNNDVDIALLEDDVGALIDRFFGLTLKNVEAGPLMQGAIDVAARHRLSIKPQFYLLIKAATTIEGLGRKLDPEFDLIAHCRPFIAKIQMEKYAPKRVLDELAESSFDLVNVMRDIPAGIKDVLTLTRKGKIKIDFEHRGLEPLYEHLEQITNRIAFAIVLAALIIGTALVILADIPPLWHGIPIVGLAGFLLAGIMGFWLLISMLRHGRM